MCDSEAGKQAREKFENIAFHRFSAVADTPAANGYSDSLGPKSQWA